MPIASSILTEEEPQADGRRWVEEVHTDHIGKQHVYRWLAEAGDDADAVMHARIPSILEGLKAQEITANVSVILVDGSLADTTTDYSTGVENFSVLREIYRTATEVEATMAGDFLSSQSDAVLRNVFGYTQAQVTNLRANKLTPAAELATSIRAQTGA